jgi:hypothetical protein
MALEPEERASHPSQGQLSLWLRSSAIVSSKHPPCDHLQLHRRQLAYERRAKDPQWRVGCSQEVGVATLHACKCPQRASSQTCNVIPRYHGCPEPYARLSMAIACFLSSVLTFLTHRAHPAHPWGSTVAV